MSYIVNHKRIGSSYIVQSQLSRAVTGIKKVQDIRPLYHDSVVFWVLEKEGVKIFLTMVFFAIEFSRYLLT